MRIPFLTALPLLLLPGAALADGNVTTTQTGDAITITGDAADNDFDVKHGTNAMGNDVLVIEGKNGTTINGQPKFEIELNPGATRFTDVSVRFSGGGDDVTVDLSGLPEDLRLEELRVSGDPNGTSTIKNVKTTPSGDIVVGTGGTVVVEGCDTETLGIKGGGAGSVTVKECNIEKKLAVDKSVADNEITIEDSFFVEIKNKSGNPVSVQNPSNFRVKRSTGRKVSYSGSDAEDEIAFEDSTIEQVSLKLGGGDDLLSFAGSTIEKVSVDGGAGDADCLDETGGGNLFASFKEKGFEPCDNVNLAFQSGAGTNPLDPETWPEGVVAWRTVNPEAAGHLDGPFALPGEGATLGLPERDPTMLAPPAHWGLGTECTEGATQLSHPHDAWEGHGDPDEEGCGHGFLEWGFFLPG